MQIGIERVLLHFDTTVDEATQQVKQYGVRFITADGRVRTMQARKLVKAPMQQLRQPLSARGGVQYNLKRNGVMMMEDVSIGQPRAVKVAMITGFNLTPTLSTGEGAKSNWLNVFH